MKLWLISQEVNGGYDTFDSAVVAAETVDEARRIHPSGYIWVADQGWTNADTKEPASSYDGGAWAPPIDVRANLVGDAIAGTELGAVICASFNAG